VFFSDYTITEELDIEQEILDEIDAEIVWANCKTEEDVLEQVGDPDAILTQWAPISRAVIEKLTRCKVISRNGIGVDNIDLDAARECGIPVVNIPGYCVPEVADHAMALILALARGIVTATDDVRAGRWNPFLLRPLWRLGEQTLGIIGLGRIGSAVARRGKPFFKKIIACDPYIPQQRFTDLAVYRVDHQEAFRQSDILTLHVPLTEETEQMIDAAALALMKPTGYLINTCRGAVVDNMALAEALAAGKLAGAGLDVHEEEPLPTDHPLRDMHNVIITPHSAFYTEEAVEGARRQTCENIVRIFNGKEPFNRVV